MAISLITVLIVNAQDYRKGEVIVKFKSQAGVVMTSGSRAGTRVEKPSARSNAVNSVLQQLGASEVRQLMPLSGSPVSRAKTRGGKKVSSQTDLSQICLLRYDESKGSVEDVIKTLKQLADVEYAEPNYIVKAMGNPSAAPLPRPEVNEVNNLQSYNDPEYSKQWGLQAINMPALWEKPVINSKRPVIAILDTGVDITHPDLAANIWTNTVEKGNDEDGNGFVGDVHGWDFVYETPDVSDPDGHGTHCAGIAAAVGDNGKGIVGANPDALIMPIKVLDENGFGSVASSIRALDYAIANGADVISMSFARACPGKSTHEGEMEAMEEAAKYVILVAASGNDGVCMNQRHQHLHGSGKLPDPYFPAAYPFVIGVQASTNNGSLANISNFDCKRTPSVTVYGEKKTPLSYETWAPGIDILSTLPSGKYGSMEGTSMACPLVAGALSRMLQTRSGMDNSKLLTMISLVSDNQVLDVEALYNVQDVDLPKHAVDEIFTAVVDGNEITFRVTSATTVQVGDGSYPAVNNPTSVVTIPETIDGLKVTSIGSYAFNCVFVDEVILPSSLIFIANSAFESCQITSVTIPESVTDIGENAFSGTHLSSVYIPQNVECVSEGAFGSIEEMTSIQVDSNNKRYDSRNNCNAIIETATGTLINGIDKIPEGVKVLSDYAFIGSAFETIDIPNTVEEIGIGTFAGCRNLKSVDLPESVVSIGFSAYNMCESLQSVHLSKNVKSLGSGAFGFCQNIKSFTIDEENPVFDSRENCNAIIFKSTNTLIHGFNCSTIPSNIEGIEYNSFYNCDKLESVFIPKTVSYIAQSPFIECHNLRSVIVDKDNPYYDSRHNCNAIIESSTNKFLWGNEHSSIPKGVRILGADAFWGSSFSGEVTIRVPEGVETIEHGSLNIWVEGGTIVFHIPSTIKNVEDYSSQYDFKALYCYAKKPIPMSRYAFRECDKSILYVPKGSKPEYEKADGWKNFQTIIEADIEITPITESEEFSFFETINEETDLTDVVLDNTYYAMDTSNGDGFDAKEQAIVLNSTTTEEQMTAIRGAEVGDDAVRNNYSGIIFEVPSGSGMVSVDVKTIGTHVLSVQIGKNEPKKVSMSERGMVEIGYSVSEPSYVYLYASTNDRNAVRTNRTRGTAENSVVLYGYKVTLEESETTEQVPIKITSAKQVPYCSDKNLDFTQKTYLKAYVATGYDKATGTIWLTRVKQVPANTGFLLLGDPGDYDIPTIDGVSDVYYKNMFKGTITGTTIYTTDGDYTNYYLSSGTSGVGFYKVTKAEGQSIGANRCYLPILTEISANGSEGDAEVIKVSAAKQVPYYTSKNLDFSTMDAQGVKAYTATGYNYKAGTIWLTRVKKVPAKTGILVMADKEGEYSVPTTSVQSVYENMFVGSETAQTIYTNEEIDGVDYVNYYLSNGASGLGFYKVTNEDGVKMGANRCYLPIPKRDAASGARGKSGESSFCKMILSDESNDDVIAIPLFADDATGINVQSSIFNLQSNEVYYNLQGQRVDRPNKGLYIRNGKKVIIR